MSEKEKSNNFDNEYFLASKLASGHYENFPVASFLVPKRLRKHVAIIYKFARIADDIADEGDFTEAERLEKLNLFEQKLNQTVQGKPNEPFWQALKNTMEEFGLSSRYFFDLLSAFKQDITKKRYADFEELSDYCRRSANPIGRLILELWNVNQPGAKILSDKICTALQLTNFYQDVSIDFAKGRIYIPQDELGRFGVTEDLFKSETTNKQFKELMAFQVSRARKMFEEGERIIEYLPGMLKHEIRWTILGGKKILYKIKKNDYNVLRKRPSLNKLDFAGLLIKTIVK